MRNWMKRAGNREKAVKEVKASKGL
jgi:hypothetical protein